MLGTMSIFIETLMGNLWCNILLGKYMKLLYVVSVIKKCKGRQWYLKLIELARSLAEDIGGRSLACALKL